MVSKPDVLTSVINESGKFFDTQMCRPKILIKPKCHKKDKQWSHYGRKLFAEVPIVADSSIFEF